MILKAQGSWERAIAKYVAVIAALLTLASPRLFADSGAAQSPETAKKPADTASGYIEKFEVPQRDDDGNLKWKLIGERAVIRPDGMMDIQNARAEFYTTNKLDMVFSSPTCRLDRAKQHARSEEHTSELQSLRHLVCRLL